MWTCDNGHAISPGDEYCSRCGAYVPPGDLSRSPEAAQPGLQPGQWQAEPGAEYPGGSFPEYTSEYTSGSFSEIIDALGETDIPPFSAEPLPDEAAWDAYRPDEPALPGPGVPEAAAPVEMDAPGGAVPDVHEPGSDEPKVHRPDVDEPGAPAGWDAPAADRVDLFTPRVPDAPAPAEPGEFSPTVPDDFGRGGLSAAEAAAPGWPEHDEPESADQDPSGDAADTPVSGFHALIRLPAALPAEQPSPPSPQPFPPSPRVTPPSERIAQPAEWAPRPTWTAPPAQERLSPPGEWHITSRPGAAASGDLLSGQTETNGTSPGDHDRAGRGRGIGGGAGGGTVTESAAEDDDGPDTAVGPTISADPLADIGYRRPSRTRLLAGVAAVAILGVTGVTGTLVVMHDHQSVASVPATNSAATSTASGQAGSARTATPAPPVPAQWSSPVPVDPQTLQSGSTHITGLACPNRTVCYATDSAGTVLSLQSGGTWPVANTDPNGHLIAISCPSDRFCLTVDAAGDATPFTQGTWGTPALVGSGSGTLTSVSCVGPSFCVAVDNIGVAFTYRGTTSGWSQQTADPSGQSLNSVSCATSTDCVAVSASGNVFRYNGTTWSGPDAVDTGQDLVSVSCPRKTSFCMAVDSGGHAAEFSNGAWKLEPVMADIEAVSCPAAGSCLAVAQSGAAESYTGGHWARAPAAAPGATINNLSCSSLTTCVATDKANNAMFYARPLAG